MTTKEVLERLESVELRLCDTKYRLDSLQQRFLQYVNETNKGTNKILIMNKTNKEANKMLKVFEYKKDKDGKKENAVDAMRILETMSELEEYNGTTEARLVDNWYRLKGEIKNAVLAVPEDPKKEGEKK